MSNENITMAAEPESAEPQPTEAAGVEAAGQQPAREPKTYTEDEFKAELEKRIADANSKAEAERRQKMQMSFEERERELAAREQKLAEREMQGTAAELLKAQGVPEVMLKFLDYSGEAAMRQSIEVLSAEYREAVTAGVKARLGENGYTPKFTNTPTQEQDAFTKAFTAKTDIPVTSRTDTCAGGATRRLN